MPNESNLKNKENENLKKYLDFRAKVKKMWKVKATVVLLVIRAVTLLKLEQQLQETLFVL